MAPQLQFLCRSVIAARNAPRTIASARRTFTTSSPLCARIWKRGADTGSHLPKHILQADSKALHYPKYPHGSARLFKQSDKGLYGSSIIQFGNNVSPRTETKTRRHWKPNVLNKALYSVALDKKIKLRVTARVLKTIDREGGLDAYLLKDTDCRIRDLGPTGWALRCRILQTPAVVLKMREEAKAAGLPEEEINKRWPSLDEMEWKAEESRVQQRGELLKKYAKLHRDLEVEARDLVLDGQHPEVMTMKQGLGLAGRRHKFAETDTMAKDFLNTFRAETYIDAWNLAKNVLAARRRREKSLLRPQNTELEKHSNNRARLYVRLGLVDTLAEGLALVKERAAKLKAQEKEFLARLREQQKLEGDGEEQFYSETLVEELDDEWEDVEGSKVEDRVLDLSAMEEPPTRNTNARL
ncbi:ribosomal L28 family-domain-containing protein [Clohesyomyces aquaticus]|uniref:Large ribosomal subunit protein bL28m n=1 Tax=Clohesyomyces aquaticus TaxID=1231657 RepID=A0A1Y2A8I1_9PLEO|nr:ribosomal L28 family-domain-containing protein [Clohesyomyces aquaticus]